MPNKNSLNNLELFLFGRVNINVNGREATGFNTRKDRALLIYLAVTGMAQSREHLAGLLWSDLPESKALRNLRHALSHLRKAIGPAWFETTADVALTQKLPWRVDVQTLRTAVDHLATILPADRTRHEIETLRQALVLYRGEFLHGFYTQKATLFEEWVVTQRSETHLLALRGLEILAQQALIDGDYQQGLLATRRFLQLEAWSEPAHRLQMQLLAASGQRAAALAHYETCRQILMTELGVVPMPETTEIYRQIQSGHYSSGSVEQQPEQPRYPSMAPPTAKSITVNTAPVANEVMVSPPPRHEIEEVYPRPAAPPRHPEHRTPHTVERREQGRGMPEHSESIPNNLFTPLAGFVGRQREVAFISEQLVAANCRLLTVVGPGGMGKSSLALTVGNHLLANASSSFPDGIFWIPLAESRIDEAEQRTDSFAEETTAAEVVLRAIASQIGCQLSPNAPVIGQLQSYVQTRRILLIIDNLEHLLDGTASVVTLLTQTPQLKMLVTSRVRLNVRGESLLTLEQLSLPTDDYFAATSAAQANPTYAIPEEIWQASGAVSMFVQRAQQLDASFAITADTIAPVGQICQLVEGLPLGIELAVSMLPMLSCKKLAAALEESLDVLASDMYDIPSEQRSLRAVFDHSWRLLSSEEQLLLARISIFPGTFDQEALAYIVGASTTALKRLIDQSLVSKVNEARYTLHRTVYAFAKQKLHRWPEQISSLQIQFAHFYLGFLARMEQGLTSGGYALATKQIHAELENVHVAWRWAVNHQMAAELNRSIYALALYSEQHRFYLEVIHLYEYGLQHFALDQKKLAEGLAEGTEREIPLLISRLHIFRGSRAARFGHFSQAYAAYETAWEILQSVEDPVTAATCLSFWGELKKKDDPKEAARLLTEAVRLIKKSDKVWLTSLLYQLLGETNFLFGNYTEAYAQIAKGCALAEELQLTRGLASAYKSLGLINLSTGNYDQAEEQLRNGIIFSQDHQLNILFLEGHIALGKALSLQWRSNEAEAYFAESRKLAEVLGKGLLLGPVYWEEGCLAEQCGDYHKAKMLFQESLSIGTPPWWSHALPTLGWALIGLSEIEEAKEYFQTALITAETQMRCPISLDAQVGLATIAMQQAETEQTQGGRNRSSGGSEQQEVATQFATTLQTVYQHPAATQETRVRVAKLAKTWAIPLSTAAQSASDMVITTKTDNRYSIAQ